MGPLYAWNLAFPALEEAYRSAKKVYEVDGADSLSDRQRLLLTYEGDVKAILKLNTAKDGIWKLQGLKNKVVVDKKYDGRAETQGCRRNQRSDHIALAGWAQKARLLSGCDRQYGR